MADYDRIGSSDPIGRVEVGYNRKGENIGDNQSQAFSFIFIINLYDILLRFGAEALEGNGRESKTSHCALACSEGGRSRYHDMCIVAESMLYVSCINVSLWTISLCFLI